MDVQARAGGLSDPLRAARDRLSVAQSRTGLLIAKDDQILFEHYQYGRTDRDRLISQSMVKSITGMLIGIAISEGAIKSVDDTAETYVPGFKGTEYGRHRSAISCICRRASISAKRHEADAISIGCGRHGARAWIFRKGTVDSITQFNHRIAPPGTRFHYASIEPDVLGIVLRYAIGKSLSDYLQEKVWQPIGTEADAKWLLDAKGLKLPHFGFNAVLRDYARLARLLAHDGAWEGNRSSRRNG